MFRTEMGPANHHIELLPSSPFSWDRTRIPHLQNIPAKPFTLAVILFVLLCLFLNIQEALPFVPKVVRLGVTAQSGHFVVLLAIRGAHGQGSVATSDKVYIFDSLRSYTLDSENSALYQEHLHLVI